jgi:hypothetical protein
VKILSFLRACLPTLQSSRTSDFVIRSRCILVFCGHPENNYRVQNAFKTRVTRIFVELKQSPYVQSVANQLDWFKINNDNLWQHIAEQYYTQRQTLLHSASKKGHLDLVKWFVEKRPASLDIVDKNFNSAFDTTNSWRIQTTLRNLD